MSDLRDKKAIIHDNYKRVLERINQAASQAGRSMEGVRLVVVTKTQPVETIIDVVEAGATDLGENYIEEAVPKIEALRAYPQLNWHMIGHLQSRKAPTFCQYFNYLHSLDSYKLAAKIDRFALEIGKRKPAWMEFNVAGEESKSGWDIRDESNWEAVLPEIKKILDLSNLEVLGVMTVPPYSENPEDSRPYFQKLKKFQGFVIDHLKLSGFTGLSMGMSSDFEVAIQEGSTCVRIGQAILGPRT